MKMTLTNRQKEIMISLRIKDAEKNSVIFNNFENGEISLSEINILCNFINDEFMMKGILPTFEPNEYGLELERLLDLINKPRLIS
jgi:hypothetical protein